MQQFEFIHTSRPARILFPLPAVFGISRKPVINGLIVFNPITSLPFMTTPFSV